MHTRLQWVVQQIADHFAKDNTADPIRELRRWSQDMGLRGLQDMGLALADFPEVAEAAATASSMKGNPFQLSQPDLLQILNAAK